MPPSTKTPSPSPSSRRIRAGNLSPASFAPFGSVIQNPSTHANTFNSVGTPRLERAEANQGTATKWLDVTRLKDWYGRAKEWEKGKGGWLICLFVGRGS